MRDLVKGACGFFGGGRQVGVLGGGHCAQGVHVCACVSEMVTTLFYSQEAPKTDGPPDAGEMG